MHINLESDYAVRLVRVLAQASDRLDGKTRSERANVSPRFTLKIMQKLVLAGVVNSYKGAHGGYVLSRPANEVTLDPYVLGKKFKRHADKIILKQNGVTK